MDDVGKTCSLQCVLVVTSWLTRCLMFLLFPCNLNGVFFLTGFNVETVEYKNISFTVWDVGGQDKVCRFSSVPYCLSWEFFENVWLEQVSNWSKLTWVFYMIANVTWFLPRTPLHQVFSLGMFVPGLVNVIQYQWTSNHWMLNFGMHWLALMIVLKKCGTKCNVFWAVI